MRLVEITLSLRCPTPRPINMKVWFTSGATKPNSLSIALRLAAWSGALAALPVPCILSIWGKWWADDQKRWRGLRNK